MKLKKFKYQGPFRKQACTKALEGSLAMCFTWSDIFIKFAKASYVVGSTSEWQCKEFCGVHSSTINVTSGKKQTHTF